MEPPRFMAGELGGSECLVESPKAGQRHGLRRKAVGEDRLKSVLGGIRKENKCRQQRFVVKRAKRERPSVNCPERTPHKRVVDSIH